MSARILDGTAVAGQIRAELSSRAAAFTRRAGRQPGLSIVLVGDKPDSQIYVNSKLKSAGDEGMRAALSHLPASTSLDEILSLIGKLNADPTTDGILVQAPLPDSLGVSAMQKVFDAIDPSKDVDGVTPENVGRLVQNRADLIACTPAGIIELLHRSSVDIAGKHAVVIGRSDIVGKPVSMLLLHRHATVTMCHSRTQNLAGIAATGDILVAAIGRPGFVRRRIRTGPERRSSTSASTSSRMPASRERFFTKVIRGAPCSSARVLCWLATCIRTSPKWPAPSRRFRAASGR